MLETIFSTIRALSRDEDGLAIGWLVLGILVGAALVVFAIIKFLIPGE